MTSPNVNINNTYIIMQNNPSFNLVFLGADNISKNEEQQLKNIIINAVSKYTEYTDLVLNIQEKCTSFFGGNWVAIVGERDKYNYCANLTKSYRVNIGPFKISVIKIN